MPTSPTPAPPLFPQGQQAFADWLFSNLYQKPGGGWNMYNLPPYPGQLSPGPNDTINNSVYGAWSPQGVPGMSNLQNISNNLNSGNAGPWLGNLQQWGGLGAPAQAMGSLSQYGAYGPLGQEMGNAVQYGGNGQPAQWQSLMAQYGAPSQAGQYTANMAQYGASSQGAGQYLQALAQGAPINAAKYLLPFLNASPYSSPEIPATMQSVPSPLKG